MSINFLLLIVSLIIGCNCTKFSLSKLLPTHLKAQWCSDVPELHFFAESADAKEEYVHQFRSSIRALSSKSRGHVVVETIGGGNLNSSFLYCNDDEKFLCHGWDNEKYIDAGDYWKAPYDELKLKKCRSTIVFSEDLLFFTNFFSSNYGHFVHDNIPGMIVFYALREKLTSNPKAKLMVPLNSISKKFLKWVPELRKNVITYRKKEKICLEHAVSKDKNSLPKVHIMHMDSPTNIFNIRSPYMSSLATTALDNIIHRPHKTDLVNSVVETSTVCKERYVVYYARASASNMYHGRPVENNLEVMSAIRRMMSKHNRKEKLIEFSGVNYTMRSQYELFRCASVVIGPHGSGIGNSMWTPHSESCQDPVHVIEVTCGSRCPNVHTSCPYNRNYFCLTGGLPWGKYHLMVLSPNSTNARTWIPVDALEVLLEGIFGGNEYKNGNVIVANEKQYHSFIEKGDYPSN